MLQNSNLEELKVNEFIPKELDLQSLRNILKGNQVTLAEMNEIISKKVVQVND